VILIARKAVVMMVVVVEKRQALLNVVCDVDANAGGD
jgi:hypothetical protein